MPAAIAVPAIIGAAGIGTSIAGSVIGSRAAKSAAQTQAEAATRAADELRATAAQVNPQIGAAADNAANLALETAGNSAMNVTDAAGKAAAGVDAATGQANELLNPYSQAGAGAIGQLSAGLGAGGDFNKTPTMADLELDPGFAFRMAEGTKALERSAAARGGALGGAALKSLTRYSQGVASDEYGKAFDRFRTSTNDRFSRLSGVATLGYNAAGTQGGNLVTAGRYRGDVGLQGEQVAGGFRTNAAQFAGNLGFESARTQAGNTLSAAEAAVNAAMGGANATAAGRVGSANAWSSGLSGASSSAMNAGMLYKLLNPRTAPATARN